MYYKFLLIFLQNKNFKKMKGKDAVLYIMGLMVIVLIIMFLMQLYTSGK